MAHRLKGLPRRFGLVEEEKRRDGQTRNGFPLVRCKKRLKPFFVATFFAVRIELRMRPNQTTPIG